MFHLHLEVRFGDATETHRLELAEKSPVFVGRRDARIVVADPSVSRRHLGLVVKNGRLIAGDMGSTHGTLLNGKKVRQARLKKGDRLELGTTEIRVRAFGPERVTKRRRWPRRRVLWPALALIVGTVMWTTVGEQSPPKSPYFTVEQLRDDPPDYASMMR